MKAEQKGFTIIEAVIALSLFSIFALLSAQTMIQSSRYTRDLEDIRLSMAVGHYFMEMFRSVGFQVLYTDEEAAGNPNIFIGLPNGDIMIPDVWKPLDPEIDSDIYGTMLPDNFWLRVNIEGFDSPIGPSSEDFKEVVLTILLTTRSGRDFVIQLSSVHIAGG